MRDMIPQKLPDILIAQSQDVSGRRPNFMLHVAAPSRELFSNPHEFVTRELPFGASQIRSEAGGCGAQTQLGRLVACKSDTPAVFEPASARVVSRSIAIPSSLRAGRAAAEIGSPMVT